MYARLSRTSHSVTLWGSPATISTGVPNGERASKRSEAGSPRSSMTPDRRCARPLRRMVMSARDRRSTRERRCCSMRASASRASSAMGGAGAGGAVAQADRPAASKSPPAQRSRLLLLGLWRRTLDPELVLARVLDLVPHLGGGRRVRVHLERLLPRLDGLVREVVLEVGVAQVLVEHRVFLGQAHRALQLAQGLLIAALLVVGPAQAVDEVAVLGLDRERLLDELDGLGQVRALLGVNVADVVVRLGVLGIDDEDAAERLDGVVEALLLLQDHSELEVEILVLVVDRQPLAQHRRGPIVLAGALERGAQVEEELGALRLEVHRLLQGGHRLVVALGAPVEEAELHARV